MPHVFGLTMLNHAIFANIVWPALYLIARLLSIWVIISGLLIEFFFLWKLLRLDAKRAFFADIMINLASALLGLILIGLLGLVVVLPFPATFGIGAWVATLIVAVIVNACIESLVVKKLFKESFAKKDFCLLVAANTLSVGIAYISLWFFPIES